MLRYKLLAKKIVVYVICLVIGAVIGATIASNSGQKYTPTKVFEDGSYFGCIENKLCSE